MHRVHAYTHTVTNAPPSSGSALSPSPCWVCTSSPSPPATPWFVSTTCFSTPCFSTPCFSTPCFCFSCSATTSASCCACCAPSSCARLLHAPLRSAMRATLCCSALRSCAFSPCSPERECRSCSCRTATLRFCTASSCVCGGGLGCDLGGKGGGTSGVFMLIEVIMITMYKVPQTMVTS